MGFRVTQEFRITGDPPTEAALERLRLRLRAAAPDADVQVGIGRMLVVMHVDAANPEGAVERARLSAAGVLGGGATRVEVTASQ